MSEGNRPLRVIVVGTSFGCQAHVRALKAAGFEVLTLVGRNANRTRERAHTLGISQALTSYEQALALANLDAVCIASPPATHRLYALQALAARKHLLCEKPMALTAAASVCVARRTGAAVA